MPVRSDPLMLLCRRWEIRCLSCSRRSSRLSLSLCRYLQCPRSLWTVSPSVLPFLCRRRWNSWWKCRRSQCTLLWFSPRRSIRGERYDVFSQDWVQHRLCPGLLTIQFLRGRGGVMLVEVFKVLSQNRVQQRLWSRLLTFQLAEVFQIFSRARVLLPHRVVCVTMQMRLLHGGFRTFPRSKKSAKLGSRSGSELLPESSPSTRRAYEDRDAPG